MSTPADDIPTSSGAPNPEHELDRRIDVVLPARTEMAATLRVICASLGADLGFSVDEIDDLRLAVNEVFTTVADDDLGRLEASFELGDGSIGVRLSVVGGAPIRLDALASTILRSLVGDLGLDDGSVSFTKRRNETNG